MAECQEKSGGSLTLYSYWRSSCSWRVRIALAYKGLKYRYEAVNLLKNEHLSEEFTKLNPLKLVPLLVDDGFEISDSVAIMEYLEEKYPSPPLLPKDLKKRALVRQAVNCVASSIQPLQNMGVLIKIGDKLGSEESIKWAQYYIEKGFKALETILKPIAGKYSCGDEFSLADIALICQLGNAARFKVDMTDFPTLKKIGENIRSLPWVEEASPEKQPDAVI